MNLEKQTTKSTLFILPLLNIYNSSIWIFNCYISLEPEQIILVCDGQLPSDIISRMVSNDVISDNIHEEINGFDVYYIMLPISDVVDFYKFVDGKYTLFSTRHKQWIMEFNQQKDKGKISKILKPSLKDINDLLDTIYDECEHRERIIEICSISDLKKEVFDKKQLMKYKRK